VNETITSLLEKLKGKPLVVWGARMTGIGFSRFSRKNDLNLIGFVDSDPSLYGKFIDGVEIGGPESIRELKEKHENLVVVVAVSIKEDEIIHTLEGFGLSTADYINFNSLCGTIFTIDVAGTCNLSCPSCAQSMDELSKSKGFMSLEDFKEITKKIVSEVDLVTHFSLYSWGEPFLHPDLNKIIRHTHSLGIAAAVSSNLSIRSAKQVDAIVKAAPDYLKISVSGYYHDVYNSTHTGGDVNLVKSNLYRLKYLMEKYKASIFVDVNYHLYKNNTGIDQVKMKELCDELGFAFSPSYANLTPVERLIDYREGKMSNATRDIAKLLLVSVEKGVEIGGPFGKLPCRFMTNQLNINWDKSVPLCCVCFEHDTSTIAKDYLTVSLEEISKRKLTHPLCTKCIEYGFPSYLLGVNQEAWHKEANKYITRQS